MHFRAVTYLKAEQKTRAATWTEAQQRSL